MELPGLIDVFRPETDLEGFLLAQPDIRAGLGWGVPRFGHPEGAVWRHIREVLDNIDLLPQLSSRDRRDLRVVAFVHDTFKFAEDKSEPRDWSRHHGVLAREYLRQFYRQHRVLELVEWHDEAYYCWRLEALYHRPSKSRQRLDALLDRFAGELQFYHRFFVCDTRTGDKNLAPLRWFVREAGVEQIGPLR